MREDDERNVTSKGFQNYIQFGFQIGMRRLGGVRGRKSLHVMETREREGVVTESGVIRNDPMTSSEACTFSLHRDEPAHCVFGIQEITNHAACSCRPNGKGKVWAMGGGLESSRCL